MGLRIATNTQAIAAQRNLRVNVDAQKDSLEKLTSGSRINKAADDAAGLAISEKIRADVRSVRQDIRNANDGISMIQTAEGAMNEIANVLVRFRELSIQAASDTIGDRERGFIEKEVEGLRDEINRIAASTEFNGKILINGEGDALEIQVGVNNNPELDRFTLDPSEINASADSLGVADMTVATKADAQDNLERVDDAIQTLSEQRATLGALQNRLQASINNLEIYDENLSASRSRMKDTDFAKETSELTKNNILQQSGIAVLSQANNNNAGALRLLG